MLRTMPIATAGHTSTCACQALACLMIVALILNNINTLPMQCPVSTVLFHRSSAA
jgi:hypothetical protein